VVNSFRPHDDIGALERLQILENDKGASRQLQILLPSGTKYIFAPFFQYANLGRPLWLAIRLPASGGVKQNPGPLRRLQLTGLVWHDLNTRNLLAGPMVRASLTHWDIWYNPVAVADLLQLQLWTDAQGAARGIARSGLN